MSLNDISYKIRGAVFRVYNSLGPGLLESVYEVALEHELSSIGFKVRKQVELPVLYNGIKLDCGYRIDIIVEDLVLIEIKSVDEIGSVHHKQVLTYMKLSGIQLGILVNFNTADISRSIFRKINDR